MADEKHIEILNLGVPVWNRWREENPEIEPDLSGADLQGRDLNFVNFQDCNLKMVLFGSSILQHVDFSKANLTAARLNNADINYAKFNEANLAGIDFEGTDRSKADFTGTRYAFRPENYRTETFLDTIFGMARTNFIFIVITFSIAILIVFLIHNCDRILGS